jgi:hypothetical protein
MLTLNLVAGHRMEVLLGLVSFPVSPRLLKRPLTFAEPLSTCTLTLQLVCMYLLAVETSGYTLEE